MAVRQYLTQIGKPTVDKEFSGLKTVTRRFQVNGLGTVAASIDSEVFGAYGVADDEYSTCLLVKRAMTETTNEQNAFVLMLTEIYQGFTSGSKVSVGEDQHFKLEDGRYGFVRRYVAIASQAEGLAAAIGDVVSSQACNDVKINKHGYGAEIIETYISAGQLKTSLSTKNNGKLLIQTLVHFNEVPATPTDYILIDEDVSGPEGVMTYTYTFAKGSGEISRATSFSKSVDEGTTGLTFIVIRHLTASSIGADPTSNPGTFIRTGVDYSDADGYRVWTVNWSKGTGVIDTEVQGRSDGSLAWSTTSLSAASATPADPSGASAHLVSLQNTIAEGYYVNRATYIVPPALITFKRGHTFNMPGTAIFSSGAGVDDLLLTPSKQQPLLCDVTVDYNATQLTTAHWKLLYGVFYQASFVRTGQTVGESQQENLSNTVSAGGTATGTAGDFYNGVECDSYDASLSASSPTSQPSGLTTIEPPINEIYLTTIAGVVLYRRTLVQYTF